MARLRHKKGKPKRTDRVFEPAIAPPAFKRQRDEDDTDDPASFSYVPGTGDDDDDDDDGGLSPDSPEDTTTPFEFDPAKLSEKLHGLEVDEEDGDGELPLVERGVAGLREMQELAQYQEPPIEPRDEAPVGDIDEDETDTTGTGTSTGTGAASTPASMMPPPSMVPGFAPDQSELLPQPGRLKDPISDIELAMGVWAQQTALSRPEYDNLKAIIDMALSREGGADDLRALPPKLDTLKDHTKSSLPLLDIRMQKIALNPDKQPSKAATSKAAGNEEFEDFMYFFDPVALMKAYLSTQIITSKMHQGLGEFVDAEAELWHSNAWHSSIRMSSGEFVRYTRAGQTPPAAQGTEASKYASQFIGEVGQPVLQSDFVRFECLEDTCECHGRADMMHLGRVLAIAHDQRSNRQHGGEMGVTAVKVQRICTANQLANVAFEPATIQNKELFLMENETFIVLPGMIAPIGFEIFVNYAFQSTANPQARPTGQYQFMVRRIVNRQGPEVHVRPIWQHHPIRGELEILHFGRQYLVDTFANNQKKVITVPFITFLDGFGLYRNMYRSLMGFYFLNAAFTTQERNRRANVIPFTIGPHGSNMSDVVSVIGPALASLDSGQMIDIEGEDTLVCGMTFYFIGDMPQQNGNAGMQTQRALYGCRICVHPSTDWKNLHLDLVVPGRYHHHLVRLRTKISSLASTTARADFAKKSGKSMTVDSPPIQRIAPALDLVLTRPPDPTHSEFGGLTKLAHGTLLDHILTTEAKQEYAKILRSFPFPPGWNRLQSPLHHLGSYILSEHGRWSVVGPILLRTWLTTKHIRPKYLTAIPQVMGNEIQVVSQNLSGLSDPDILYPHVITLAYARMAGSNMKLMSNFLTPAERSTMVTEIELGRRFFQLLNDTAALAAETGTGDTPRSSRAGTPVEGGASGSASSSRASSRGRGSGSGRGSNRGRGRGGSTSASASTPDVAQEEVEDDDQALDLAKTSTAKTRANACRALNGRPNVHTGLHYPAFIKEYGLASFFNVLMGEDQHRLFKQLIYGTNHRNPERDLLQRINFDMTIRFLALGGLSSTESQISQQIQRINRQCPNLFDKVLPVSERSAAERAILGDDEEAIAVLNSFDKLVPGDQHTGIRTRMKIDTAHVRDVLGLPVKTERMGGRFKDQITTALDTEYSRKNVTVFGTRPIKWWKEVSYDDGPTHHRITLHRGDFVRCRNDTALPARIDHIFTVSTTATTTYCFLVVSPNQIATTDQVTGLPVYRLTANQTVVGLTAVRGKKQWVVPIDDDRSRYTLGPVAAQAPTHQQMLHVTWDTSFL